MLSVRSVAIVNSLCELCVKGLQSAPSYEFHEESR